MSVAVLVIVAAGLGAFLLRGKSFSGLDGLVFRLYMGFAVCAAGVLAAGSVSLGLSQLILVLAAAVWLAYEIFGRNKSETEPAPANNPEPISLVEYVSLAAVFASLGVSLISAFAPITGWDASVAHAALAADYARAGRIGVVPGNEYSGYPNLLHVLFAQAYYSDGEIGLGLLNWWFAVMACGAAYALGRRIQGRACGLISSAILATAPIFVDQAAAPSIDLAFTGFTLAAVAAFVAWLDDRGAEWLLVAAVLAGASCGVRHTGYLVCAILAVAGFIYGRQDRLRAPAWFSFVALIAASPWLIRSAIVTGNPVYPFFASAFGGAAMQHREITGLAAHESVKAIGVRDFLMFPWNIVMRTGTFDGWSKSPGGLVLILGIPGLFTGGRKARRLGLFSAAGVAAFYFFQRLARYILPFFAPMMVVGAAGVVRMRSLRFVTIPALAAVFLFGLTLAAGANHFKIRAAFGIESREEYLERRVERYPAFDWINNHVPPEDLVLTLDRRTYYLTGRSWQNDEPLRRLASADPQARLDWMRLQGVKWIMAPVDYVKESPGLRDPFCAMIEEWRLDTRHYRLVKRLDLPRTRRTGREIVDIYEVRYD
ncbi:MAG: glycosyltransferase family 39 protein [Candidatus Hydrogenedentes bacterium]|nr:glycosyltransferase family 39 protein [Candidatus Hydrogenedentota bacterium]